MRFLNLLSVLILYNLKDRFSTETEGQRQYTILNMHYLREQNSYFLFLQTYTSDLIPRILSDYCG